MAGAIAIAFVLAIAAYYPFCVMWPFAVDPEWRILSGDAYTYSYPTRIYLREAFERGHGLLWNDFQNSGQPFLGMIGVALFYPTTLLYLFVDIDLAVYLEVAINFAICGVGMYFLCRELRLAPLASVAGAAALQLGGIGTGLAGWTSLIFGAFAWIPITLLFCERLLRSPTLPASLGLGPHWVCRSSPVFPRPRSSPFSSSPSAYCGNSPLSGGSRPARTSEHSRWGSRSCRSL